MPKFCGVPKQFDLSKYEELKNQDFRYLATQLNYRRPFLCDTNKPNEQWRNSVLKLLEAPLINESPFVTDLRLHEGQIDCDLVTEPAIKDLLRHTRNYDAYKDFMARLAPDLLKDEGYFEAGTMLHDLDSYRSGVNPDEVLLMVNLNAKDEAIVEAFTKYLSKVRKLRQHNEPNFLASKGVQTEAEKIISENVLGFIDLTIWEKMFGKEISKSKKLAVLGQSYSQLKKMTRLFDQAVAWPFIESLKATQRG